MSDVDILIVGAGAAGLSLAYHLNQAGLTHKHILLIDHAPKTANDRTWCFWERGAGVFEPVVCRHWDRVAFYGQAYSGVLDMASYRYKMIRAGDFYQFMSDWLSTQPNIARVIADVTGIIEDGEQVIVRAADGRTFRGQQAFNSIQFKAQPKRPGKHYLLQHFLGWVIYTPSDAFDPGVATLMDFRVEQATDTRFAYVLPFDEHTALVEYTVFSRELWPDASYRAALEAYIRGVLHIERFEEQHEESGVIPMTDAPYPVQLSARVINIGTAGGCTKPSTGYTFQRIQRQSRQIARALAIGCSPNVKSAWPQRRYALFDSVFLNVLDKGRSTGKRVFTDLFQHNPPQRVFRFLDEDTTLAEDIAIMGSVNVPAFLAATADVIKGRVWR